MAFDMVTIASTVLAFIVTTFIGYLYHFVKSQERSALLSDQRLDVLELKVSEDIVPTLNKTHDRAPKNEVLIDNILLNKCVNSHKKISK